MMMSGTTVPGQPGHVTRDNGTGHHPPFRGCPACPVPPGTLTDLAPMRRGRARKTG